MVPILHWIAFITGMIGLLALAGAWIAGEGGELLNLSQAHLFEDAKVHFLASIAFGVGTLIHQNQEKK